MPNFIRYSISALSNCKQSNVIWQSKMKSKKNFNLNFSKTLDVNFKQIINPCLLKTTNKFALLGSHNFIRAFS